MLASCALKHVTNNLLKKESILKKLTEKLECVAAALTIVLLVLEIISYYKS